MRTHSGTGAGKLPPDAPRARAYMRLNVVVFEIAVGMDNNLQRRFVGFVGIQREKVII